VEARAGFKSNSTPLAINWLKTNWRLTGTEHENEILMKILCKILLFARGLPRYEIYLLAQKNPEHFPVLPMFYQCIARQLRTYHCVMHRIPRASMPIISLSLLDWIGLFALSLNREKPTPVNLFPMKRTYR
jgi:hypothetical protein